MTTDRSYVIEHEDMGATLIPTRVMLDPRIPLKARGLYAVLRSIPAGTRLNDAALQSLSYHDGRDALRAAKRILCRHGLLRVQQDRAHAGRFSRTVWLLRAEAERTTADGKSVRGLSGDGLPGRGHPDDGKSVHGRKPDPASGAGAFLDPSSDVRSSSTSSKTTTYSERQSPGERHLIAPTSLPTAQAHVALRMVSSLPPDVAQEVLDELEGIKRRGAIKKTWEACLRGIVRAAEKGEFNFTVGREVLADRDRRIAEHQLTAQREAERRARKPSSPDVAKARLKEISSLLGSQEAAC